MNASQALKLVLDGESLESAQMEAVFHDLFQGQADPVGIGGLLVALASRSETRGEILGAARAMRAAMVPFEHDQPNAIDTCGTGGSGLDTFNISTCAAIVAAAAGAPVIKHGNRSASSKCGSADLLEALGIPLELTPQAARKVFEEVGITFLFAPSYHPAMRFAGPVRRSLGVHTIFNLLGPLCNPGRVTSQVLGVFDERRVADLGSVLEQLGTKRAMVVHGTEGADELTLAADNAVSSLGGVPTAGWNAPSLGLEVRSIKSCSGGDAQDNMRMLHKLFDAEHCPARDFVLINSAAALVVAKLASSAQEGVDLAREAMDSGAAKAKLAQWVACAQGVRVA
jgi:anthranilate phosphoribosyltransferase